MRILHITDLHAGWLGDLGKEKKEWGRFCQEIVEACSGESVDMMAVTGDLVMHGTEEEYRRIEGYVHGLRQRLGLGKQQVFFCSGNHDSDTPDACSTYCQYENFLKRFYGEAEIPQQGTVIGGMFQIYAINSCKKTSLTDFNNCWMEPQDAKMVLAKARTGCRGILLLHHQPEMFDDQTWIEQLSSAVSLIMGGHLHSGYTRQYSWKGMTVVNGLAMTPHLPFIPRGFQVTEIRDDGKIETEMYVYQGEKGTIKWKA